MVGRCLGWAGLLLLGLLGAVSSGVSGLLILTGLYVLVVAVIALIRGRVRWARIRTRPAGGMALTVALGLLIAGAATADPAPSGPSSSPATNGRTSTPVAPRTTTAPTSHSSTTVPPRSTSTSQPAPRPGTALAALASLPVKGRAPMTGYTRQQFGQAWADTDRNGCDTRNDILRRDLTGLVLKAGTNGCLVLRGTLHDPYSGRIIQFVRGPGTSTAVQIDHVVALGDAWQKGAQRLSLARRTELANDPLNLLAVDGPTNLAKGDGDAATWLPPATGFRCSYVARQVAVKSKYDLWVTPAERDAIQRILLTCPAQKLPTAGPVPLRGGKEEAAPTQSPTRTTSSSTGSLDPRYPSCKAAHAAGFGPYVRGKDPEYDWYRDADGDGIVCE